MNRKYLFLLCCLLAMLGCTTVQPRQAGIYQFVEERKGRESVWGIDIQLDHLSFQPEVKPDEIKIVDGKYARDLKSIMIWSVSPDRECLHIRFKPGMGDFGTGNGVTVHIQKSALVGYEGINNRFEWSILTDVQ